uniref:Putative conserved secreted protein n=1 Tax=Ixodes scapularis TaxID=6945 RepID=A0A4D5RH60_IXOSC
MKLLLPFLLAGLLTLTCGASIEPVETTKPEEVAEEAEEYRWRRKVGETLERVGKWLQGKYSAATEEEELEMALLIAELEQPDVSGKDILSEHDDEVGEVDEVDEVDEVEDEVVPYGLRKKFSKWRKKIVDAGKKVATAVVINKAAGAVVAATG